MKKLLSVTVFIVICSLLIEAQTSQGNFLVGISSSLSVAGTGPDLMSIGYSTTGIKVMQVVFRNLMPIKHLT